MQVGGGHAAADLFNIARTFLAGAAQSRLAASRLSRWAGLVAVRELEDHDRPSARH